MKINCTPWLLCVLWGLPLVFIILFVISIVYRILELVIDSIMLLGVSMIMGVLLQYFVAKTSNLISQIPIPMPIPPIQPLPSTRTRRPRLFVPRPFNHVYLATPEFSD